MYNAAPAVRAVPQQRCFRSPPSGNRDAQSNGSECSTAVASASAPSAALNQVELRGLRAKDILLLQLEAYSLNSTPSLCPFSTEIYWNIHVLD